MAYLQNDILGLVMNYHELEPVVVVAEIGVAVRVKLSSNDGILIDEAYWPDFNGQVVLDISDVVAQGLYLEIPDIGKDHQQTSIFKAFNLDINDGEISGVFTVNGYSKLADSRMSDIDTMRVPSDYILPLSLANLQQRDGISIHLQSGVILEREGLSTDGSGLGCVSHFLSLDGIDGIVAGQRLQARLTVGDSIITGPVLEVCNGKFEQYLFANRYGGFDNIAMDGQLMFVPELSFETGICDGAVQQVESDATYQYTQNSGYLSRKVMEIASELLCSPQIYHFVDGSFRPIVIIESDLQSASRDNLHSFSFKYKYADGSRPKMLTTAKQSTPRRAERLPALMYPVSDSPMTIVHNRSGHPCVTVVDDNLNVVEVAVEYLDESTVRLSWNGELSGYIFIN